MKPGDGGRATAERTSKKAGVRRRAALRVPVVLPALLALTLPAGADLAAQSLPHPREMSLPDVRVERPDPGTHRIALENGLVAFHAEDRTVPLVTLGALVRTGAAHGSPGAVAALVRAFRRGPADPGPEGFSERLREMAADYRVSAGPETVELTLDVPATDAAAAVGLLARTLRAPGPTAADVDAVAGPLPGAAPGTPSGGEAVEGSPDAALRLFRAHLYGSHPYGPSGTRDPDAALTVADVREVHRRLVGPGSVVLSVAGAVEREEARRLITEHFGDWAAGGSARPTSPPPLDAPDGRRVHLHQADALQGWIVIGHELPPVPEEDAAALEVMNYILGGGHFDTRLFRATRDRRGLTNDASGFPVARLDGPGTYTFRTSGRPGAVKLLVELTFREIERIRSEPVTEEELFVAKGALADGAFADRYRDGWATARSLARERLRRGHHRRSETYRERIRAVTADDVREAARTYLHPDRMQVVIVGPLDRIRAAPPMEDERTLEVWGALEVHAPSP